MHSRGHGAPKVLAILAALILLGSARAAAAQALDMSFIQVQGGACPSQGCIMAAGPIGPEAVREFSRYLAAHRPQPGALVLLDSPGGDLVQALKLGVLIHRAGLDTRVQARDALTGAWIPGAQCASACAYLFLGGRQRDVPPGSSYGLHQFRATDCEVQISAERAQQLIAEIMIYLDAVGASPRLVGLAASTPPDRMRWVSPTEMIQLRVVTHGSTFASNEATLAGPPQG